MSNTIIHKGIEVLFLKDTTTFKPITYQDIHSKHSKNNTVFKTYKPINEKESINLIDSGYVIFEGRSNTYAGLCKYFNRFGYID